MHKQKRRGKVSSVERREKALMALAELLREKPHTARGIAERLKISKPSAYARVAALAMSGHKVNVAYIRDGLRGPVAKAYSIAA